MRRASLLLLQQACPRSIRASGRAPLQHVVDTVNTGTSQGTWSSLSTSWVRFFGKDAQPPPAAAPFVPPRRIEDLYEQAAGGIFSSINRPTAGARIQQELPEGKAPLQLYSLGTPNGQKVSILLEELVDAVGLEYDAHNISIGSGDQFTSGFVRVNPNSKIPALVDKQGQGGPMNVFESGSINLYLCEKYKKFIPSDIRLKTEVMSWSFWQDGMKVK
eukprot:gene23169-30377_t